MIDDEFLIDPYEPHEHFLDPRRMICVHCGITAEAIHLGRDKRATWEDVDEAYQDGRRIGIVLGELEYKYRRRKKLIEVGFWLCLRNLSRSVERDYGNNS